MNQAPALPSRRRTISLTILPEMKPAGAPPGVAVQWPTAYRFFTGVRKPVMPLAPAFNPFCGWYDQPEEEPRLFSVNAPW